MYEPLLYPTPHFAYIAVAIPQYATSPLITSSFPLYLLIVVTLLLHHSLTNNFIFSLATVRTHSAHTSNLLTYNIMLSIPFSKLRVGNLV